MTWHALIHTHVGELINLICVLDACGRRGYVIALRPLSDAGQVGLIQLGQI